MKLRRKPHLTVQYKRLAGTPLWRLFKVVYAVGGAILICIAFGNSYSVTCEDQATSYWAAKDWHWGQPHPNPPCNDGPALLAALWGGVMATLGLLLLFLIIRRVAAYIAYGNPTKNGEKRDMA